MTSWAFELTQRAENQKTLWRPEDQARLYQVLSSVCRDPEAEGRYYPDAEFWVHESHSRPRFEITYDLEPELRRVRVLAVHCRTVSIQVLVFVSYSHQDEDWLRRFKASLARLRDFDIDFRSDQDLKAGQLWLDFICDEIAGAGGALLLVSQSFLESEFVRHQELPRFLARAEPSPGAPFAILWVPLADKKAIAGGRLGRRLLKFQALHPPEEPLHQLGDAELERTLPSLCFEILRALKT